MENSNQHSLSKYAAVCAVVAAAYFIWRLIPVLSNTVISIIMAALLLLGGGYLIKCRRKNTLTDETILKVIIFSGFVMRIGYMLYTPCDERSHDLWQFDPESGGHAGYILCLAQNHSLPQTNHIQYYQQPFFYICASIISIVINAPLGTFRDSYWLVDAAKTLSCACSCMTLLLAERLCEMFSLSGKTKNRAMTVVAFLPAFYLSCRVTPDMLVCFMMTLALIYTLRWHKNPSWKNTITLAVIYGLGVLTKISMGVLALFTAVFMLEKLISSKKTKRLKETAAKLTVFGCISLPLGLWYSIRNMVRFRQFPTSVPNLGDSSPLYTGDHSIFQRFVIPDFASLFESPYIDLYSDYSLPIYALKTSLFGEFTYSVYPIIPITLLFAALFLAVLCAAGMFACFKKGGDKRLMILGGACWLFWLSLAAFYYDYPHTCSMDFRYMTFLPAPCAILMARFLEGKNKTLTKFTDIGLTLFAGCSCLMYCLV